jgi:hypothetical protein
MEASRALSQADISAYCPITDEVCPARQKLIELYTEGVTPEVRTSLSADLSRASDSVKLGVKLVEMTTQAQLRGCGGVDDAGACPTRTAMNESPARQTFVDGIRKLIQRNRS